MKTIVQVDTCPRCLEPYAYGCSCTAHEMSGFYAAKWAEAADALTTLLAEKERLEGEVGRLRAALFLADEGIQFKHLYVELAYDVHGDETARAALAD